MWLINSNFGQNDESIKSSEQFLFEIHSMYIQWIFNEYSIAYFTICWCLICLFSVVWNVSCVNLNIRRLFSCEWEVNSLLNKKLWTDFGMKLYAETFLHWPSSIAYWLFMWESDLPLLWNSVCMTDKGKVCLINGLKYSLLDLVGKGF